MLISQTSFSGTTDIAAPLFQTLSAQAANVVEPAMTTDTTIYCNVNKIDVAQSVIETFPTAQPEVWVLLRKNVERDKLKIM